MRISDWSSDVCSSDLATRGKYRSNLSCLGNKITQIKRAIALNKCEHVRLFDHQTRSDIGDRLIPPCACSCVVVDHRVVQTGDPTATVLSHVYPLTSETHRPRAFPIRHPNLSN